MTAFSLRWVSSGSDTHIYIYVTTLPALLVPKAVFSTPKEQDRFIEMVMHYRELAAGLAPAQTLEAERLEPM